MTKLKLYIFVFGILVSLNLKSQYSNIFEKKDNLNCLKIKIIDKKLISVIDSFINTIKYIDEYRMKMVHPSSQYLYSYSYLLLAKGSYGSRWVSCAVLKGYDCVWNADRELSCGI